MDWSGVRPRARVDRARARPHIEIVRLAPGAVTLYRDGGAARYFQVAVGFLATALLAALTLWLYAAGDRDATRIAVLFGGMAIWMMGALIANLARLFRRGNEAVTCSDVEIDGCLVRAESGSRVVRSEVQAGWFEFGTALTGPAVELCLASGDTLLVRVASEEDGAALLEKLGLDPGQRAAAFPIEPAAADGVPRKTLFVMTIASALVLGAGLRGAYGHAGALAVLAIATGLAGWGVARIGSGVAIVGSDGVAVRTARRRFIPYSEIREVVRDRSATTLRLRRGRPVRLVTPERGAADTTVGDALTARIREAMDSAATLADATARLGLLDRNGRGFEAWLKDARGALSREPGYRGTAISREELAAVLEDAGAPVERRVAAAAALGAEAEPGLRVRVAAAAGACASDALREALAKAYAGELDEETLERAQAVLRS